MLSAIRQTLKDLLYMMENIDDEMIKNIKNRFGGNNDTENSNPAYPIFANLTIIDHGSSNTQRNSTDQEYQIYLSDTLGGPNGIYTRFISQISPNYTITVPATSDSGPPKCVASAASVPPPLQSEISWAS